MQIRKMSIEEQNAFLAQPLVGVFAVNERAAAPHQTPVWFQYDPEEHVFYVMSKASSKKIRLLENWPAGYKMSLCIQESEGATAKYVNMSGSAEFLVLSRDMVQLFAEKYLPPVYREAYVADTPEDTLLRITPRKMITGVI